MQHGSADNVVRAMSVKYRKWHLGESPVTPKPLNRFSKNLASVITLPTRPNVQNLDTVGSKEAWLRKMQNFRHLIFFFLAHGYRSARWTNRRR